MRGYEPVLCRSVGRKLISRSGGRELTSKHEILSRCLWDRLAAVLNVHTHADATGVLLPRTWLGLGLNRKLNPELLSAGVPTDLNRCLVGLRCLDKTDDLGQHSLGANTGSTHIQQARAVDGAANHAVTRLLGDLW